MIETVESLSHKKIIRIHGEITSINLFGDITGHDMVKMGVEISLRKRGRKLRKHMKKCGLIE
jgi:hypothetical protein